MYRVGLLLIVIIAAFAFIQCSDKPTDTKDFVTSDSLITLKAGQTALILPDSLRVTFSDLLSEGRCPSNVSCFWEGMAEIRTMLSKPGHSPLNVPIAISGSSQPYPVIAYGYRISLKTLTPYPADFAKPNPFRVYSATILIEDASDLPIELKPVIISDAPQNMIKLDQFDLADISINGDTLKAVVRYGGGCWLHTLQVYMSPAAFLESNPVQANLYIRHYSNGDMCMAYIKDSVLIDLNPIANLYQNMYGQLDLIRINVYDYFDSLPGDFLYDYYDPQ